MNTFLPYSSYKASAKILDRQRLGKQRVECMQLVNTLLNGGTAWANHPCTRMWRPWVQSLIEYGMIICEEWVDRGYQDTIWTELYLLRQGEAKKPGWLGSPKLHLSHRSNLMRKDPIYYPWKDIDPTLPYFWPTSLYFWRAYEVPEC